MRFLQFPRKTWVFSLSLEMAKVGVGDASSKQFCLCLFTRMTLYLSHIPGLTNTALSHFTQSLGKEVLLDGSIAQSIACGRLSDSESFS